VYYSLWKEDGIIRMSITFSKLVEKDKESLHLAVGTGKNGAFTYGKDGTAIDFQTSRLPGSNADFICTSNMFKLNYGKHTACVYSPQMNLVEVGNVVNEEQVYGAKVWKENTTDLSKMYLYLFNNYWHTNYKAYQDGYFSYQIDFWME
jgi:alpha-mannosidase